MTIGKAEEILHTLSPVVIAALWNDYCNCSGRGSEVIYRMNSTTINQIFKDKTTYEILRGLAENTNFDINDSWFWVINGKPKSFNNPLYFIRTDIDFLQHLIDSGKIKENQA